jgi:hypothetical protein
MNRHWVVDGVKFNGDWHDTISQKFTKLDTTALLEQASSITAIGNNMTSPISVS